MMMIMIMELPETDSKSTSIECSICGTTKILTYRLYGTKRKIYSMIPAGTSKRVTLICHRCLTEEPWKNLLKRID
jgi:hypothetical protein